MTIRTRSLKLCKTRLVPELARGLVIMSEDSDFPGLNKKHGFFKVIERNQKDRDDYHHKQEPIKQVQICLIN